MDDLRGHRRVGDVSAWLSLLALAASGVVVGGLDCVVPGAGPLTRPLSSLAHTDYARVWMLAVEMGAMGVWLVAVTVYGRGARMALVAMLGVAGAGLVVTGVCSADLWFPWERTPTVQGVAHLGAVGVTGLALVGAMLVRRGALPGDWRVRRDRWIEWVFGVGCGAAGVYVAVAMVRGEPLGWFGFWERLLLVVAGVWCGSLAVGRWPRRAVASPN